MDRTMSIEQRGLQWAAQRAALAILAGAVAAARAGLAGQAPSAALESA
ncbi:hypothetical protein SCE1572_09370 [Sorangium cellulosum So0157-2]|uniref:Uncharacterized protein n=1 Tax=Sorangium cellulosum So0157-2 TaxID=1254432 RepID=S4XVR2_SORCE|nr:hypothetical protein SCE1572_09370 [Sorangium cellulosum So0157-2]